MAIIHKNLPDNQLHEPKGAASATVNTAYFSNGTGSGTWKKVPSAGLSGLSGDSSIADRYVVTDGIGGFKLLHPYSTGVMGITNNSTAFSVTASADATLQSTTDYVLFSGLGAPWASEILDDVSFTTNRLIVTYPGLYEIKFWANISTYPSNTAAVGARFRVNATTWAARTVVTKSNSADDVGHLSAFGYINLNANDYVQLYVAATATGNLIMKNANLTLELKKGP